MWPRCVHKFTPRKYRSARNYKKNVHLTIVCHWFHYPTANIVKRHLYLCWVLVKLSVYKQIMKVTCVHNFTLNACHLDGVILWTTNREHRFFSTLFQKNENLTAYCPDKIFFDCDYKSDIRITLATVSVCT